MTVKAHVFLDKVMSWKAKGVSNEYFSVDRVDNDAEVMIAEVTKGSYCNTQLSSRTEPLSFIGSLIDIHDNRTLVQVLLVIRVNGYVK